MGRSRDWSHFISGYTPRVPFLCEEEGLNVEAVLERRVVLQKEKRPGAGGVLEGVATLGPCEPSRAECADGLSHAGPLFRPLFLRHGVTDRRSRRLPGRGPGTGVDVSKPFLSGLPSCLSGRAVLVSRLGVSRRSGGEEKDDQQNEGDREATRHGRRPSRGDGVNSFTSSLRRVPACALRGIPRRETRGGQWRGRGASGRRSGSPRRPARRRTRRSGGRA